jgi:hypothetical protein
VQQDRYQLQAKDRYADQKTFVKPLDNPAFTLAVTAVK